MSEKTKPFPDHRPDHRSVGQALRVMLMAAVIFGLLWAASGGRYGNQVDNDRLVVAECWNALERKAAQGRSLADEAQACQRMERGFAQMYGHGA